MQLKKKKKKKERDQVRFELTPSIKVTLGVWRLIHSATLTCFNKMLCFIGGMIKWWCKLCQRFLEAGIADWQFLKAFLTFLGHAHTQVHLIRYAKIKELSSYILLNAHVCARGPTGWKTPFCTLLLTFLRKLLWKISIL